MSWDPSVSLGDALSFAAVVIALGIAVLEGKRAREADAKPIAQAVKVAADLVRVVANDLADIRAQAGADPQGLELDLGRYMMNIDRARELLLEIRRGPVPSAPLLMAITDAVAALPLEPVKLYDLNGPALISVIELRQATLTKAIARIEACAPNRPKRRFRRNAA